MSSQPLRKSSPQKSSPPADEYEFVPPILRERIDPAQVYAELDKNIGAIKAGRIVPVDGEQFFAELGAELKRLKA
jgi:hypothetical protein